MRGGKGRGQGRKPGSLKPWGRIDIGERFYARLAEVSEREGRRAVHATNLTLYAEDFPDKVGLHDGDTARGRIKVLDEWVQHFADWRETQGRLRARGRSEDQAMADGHWDEWFRALWDKRMKRLRSRRRRKR